jgi:hypothetical protein
VREGGKLRLADGAAPVYESRAGDPVAGFVAYAARGETIPARQLVAQLERRGWEGIDPAVRDGMQRWMQLASGAAPPPSPKSPATPAPSSVLSEARESNSKLAERATSADPDPGLERWLVLDALLWPRRGAADLVPAVETLAERFASRAEDPRARERARLYLAWLSDRSDSAAERERWQSLLRQLPQE